MVTNPVNLQTATQYYGVNGVAVDYGLPGQVKSVTDVDNGDTTSYRYDIYGRLTKVIRPYDSFSQPTTAYTYYDRSWPPPAVRTQQREESGQGGTLDSWQFYDGLGRLIQSQAEGPSGNLIIVNTHYNNRGLQEKTTVPRYLSSGLGTFQQADWQGSWPGTTTIYDALGRVVVVANPDGTTVQHQYDYHSSYGWREQTIDENGHKKVHFTDPFGRMVRVHEWWGQEAGQYYVTQYAYDVRDNLTGVTDAAGNVSTMSYDLLGRKVAMHDPDMGDWSYGYDAVGNLTSQTDAKGQTIGFTYDALNRLTQKDYPSGSDVYYKYDNFKGDAPAKNSWGRLRVMYVGSESANGHLYEYDNRGRVVKEQVKVDGVTYNTSYTYDAMDRVKTMTYPDGEVVTTAYNAQGLPQTLRNNDSPNYYYVSATTYDPLGRVDLLTLGNSRQVDNVYYAWTTPNGQGRLQQIKTGTDSDPTLLQNLTYTYDAVGNVVSIADAKVSGGTQTQSFSYDALDRLLSASASGGSGGQGQYSESYSYNAIGNLMSKGGVNYTYPASGQGSVRPHAVSSTSNGGSFSYDNNGNMTSRRLQTGGTTYSQQWDYENRLKQVTYSGHTTTFTYDGNGALVKKVVGGVTTVYVGQHYEKNLSSAQVTKYYYFNGRRLALRQAGVVYYLLTDHLGSTALTVDGNGAKVGELRYKAWGETRYTWGTFPTDYRYTGQRQEEGLELYRMGARWYDPALSRWLSADTLVPGAWEPQALNRYSYVYNNPLAYIDNDGHNPLVVAALVGGGVGFLITYAPQVVSNLKSGQSLGDAAFNNVDWGKVAGGTVAGAIAGGTMGLATHVGAGVVGTILLGASGGALGGQVGALVEAGTDQFFQWASGHGWDNTELLQDAFDAGFLDPTTLKYDTFAGGMSAGAGFALNKVFSSAMKSLGDKTLEGVVPQISFLPGRNGMVATVELAGRTVVLSSSEFENLIKSALVGAYEPVSELLQQLLEEYIKGKSQP